MEGTQDSQGQVGSRGQMRLGEAVFGQLLASLALVGLLSQEATGPCPIGWEGGCEGHSGYVGLLYRVTASTAVCRFLGAWSPVVSVCL